MNDGTPRALTILAFAILLLAPQAALAGTSTGVTGSPPARDIDMNANLVCSISLTIARETVSGGPGATALDSTGFVDDTGLNQDTIDFGDVNLLGGSMPLNNGGDAWLNADDSSVNIIGELAITVQHNCTIAPTATIEAVSPGVSGVTVRYDTSHNGNGWEGSNYNLLSTATPFTYTSGVDVPLDLGFNVPQDATAGGLNSVVTITTVGGS